MIKKCVIITTINNPNEVIRFFENDKNFDLIVIGDNKTPDNSYKDLNGIYLSIKDQEKLYPSISRLIGYNHYARKNLGYIYAINNNYDIIYETDDDNFPIDLNFNHERVILDNYKTFNAYKFYTDKHIWPRGYPLDKINTNHDEKFKFSEFKEESKIAATQGLVNINPDVDAIFRLTSKIDLSDFKFNRNLNNNLVLPKKTFGPGNTQNTYWRKKSVFYSLYLPSKVSFRYTDILKLYIAQRIFWEHDLYFEYCPPNVNQYRNQHNLFQDLNSEFSMYLTTNNLIKTLSEIKIPESENPLIAIYNSLIEVGIIPNDEFKIIKEWLRLIKF